MKYQETEDFFVDGVVGRETARPRHRRRGVPRHPHPTSAARRHRSPGRPASTGSVSPATMLPHSRRTPVRAINVHDRAEQGEVLLLMQTSGRLFWPVGQHLRAE